MGLASQAIGRGFGDAEAIASWVRSTMVVLVPLCRFFLPPLDSPLSPQPQSIATTIATARTERTRFIASTLRPGHRPVKLGECGIEPPACPKTIADCPGLLPKLIQQVVELLIQLLGLCLSLIARKLAATQ